VELVLVFLAGMFLANATPHFIKGVTGQSHMTPFMRVSPSWLNIVWSFVNIVFGLFILRFSEVSVDELISLNGESVSFLAGVVVMALSCAMLFSNPNARFPWHKD
jgi:hypothetical protein